MSGTDAIKGFSYQTAYTLYRLLNLVQDQALDRTVAVVEGTGADVEDLALRYRDGTEEVVQIKKRETREGAYGQWALSDIQPVILAFHRLTTMDRDIVVFRFVATGNAQARIISIQQSCQRLRDGTFSPERNGRAVEDIREIIDSNESGARRFMRRLWLDLPFDTEDALRAKVQDQLVRGIGVPPRLAERVYNDLTARILEKGKQTDPAMRTITCERLLQWVENPLDPMLEPALRTKVAQRVRTLRGRLVGAEMEGMAKPSSGTLNVDQEISTVSSGGEAVGLIIKKNPR